MDHLARVNPRLPCPGGILLGLDVAFNCGTSTLPFTRIVPVGCGTSTIVDKLYSITVDVESSKPTTHSDLLMVQV